MLDASPAQVFAAWTKPDQVSSWWDPTGQALVACEIDLRPGGAFKFVPRDHPAFTGTYTEIVPNERLAFEALGAVGRVAIVPAAGGSKLSVEIQCRSAEHLQQFLALGVHEGTARTLDNLAIQIARH
jgi:uncharacterized protein YndB with AHSA1/START domain